MIHPDIVAAAIVQAAKERNVDPFAIVGAVPIAPADQIPVSRARALAAVAIDDSYNAPRAAGTYDTHRVSRTSIARMLGSSPASQKFMVLHIQRRILDRTITWWDKQEYARVLAAVTAQRKIHDGRHQPSPEPVKTPVAPSQAVPRQQSGDQIRKAAAALAKIRAKDRKTDSPAAPAAPPVPVPSKPPAPPPAAASAPKPASPAVIRNAGIEVDEGNQTITARGTTVWLPEPETLRMIAVLVQVTPALLPGGRIIPKVWGRMTPDGGYMLSGMAERANHVLAQIGYKIRSVPKIGYSISPI